MSRIINHIFVAGLLFVGISACKTAQQTAHVKQADGLFRNSDTSSVSLRNDPQNSNGSVVILDEIAPSGKTIKLSTQHKVIDPNSKLQITFNETALYDAVTDGNDHARLVKKLNSLKKMLQAEVTAMKALQTAISSYGIGSDWKGALASLHEFTVLIFDEPDANTIYEGMPPTNDIVQQYSNMFITAGTFSKQLEEEMKAEAQKNGIYIQVGAWIESKEGQRPVHVPGFDDLAESVFRVEQYQIILTEEQKKEVEELGVIAKKANEEGLLEALKAKETTELLIAKILETQSAEKLKLLQTEIKKYLDSANMELGSARQALQASFDHLQQYRNSLTSLVTKYKQQGTEDASSLLLQINGDVESIQDQTKLLATDLLSTAAKIDSSLHTLAGSTQNILRSTVTQLKGISATVASEITNFYNDIRSSIGMIISGERLSRTGNEFAKEVRRVSFDQLQHQTILNLETTGKRDIGDILSIKVVAGKGDGSSKELAGFRYYLHFCTPYVRTSVNFLLGDPVPLFERAEGKALFQYAPSYSFLLKGFWKNEDKARRSLTYHNLYSPGIGINIATLDFNGDGAPEVGVGGVFSIFQDFIQIGYGFNTYEGRGYSFFALKLPVGSMSLR